MASEAFIRDRANPDLLKGRGEPLIETLVTGNGHTSKFAKSDAQDFAGHWEALDQKLNTPAGFSGTLFRCIANDPKTGAKAGELVIDWFKTSNGQVLQEAQVQNLVEAMSAFAPPSAGQTTLSPECQAALLPTIAANWQ